MILFVSALDLAGSGGAVRRTHQLASLLARSGREVRLLGFGESRHAAYLGLDSAVRLDLVPDHASAASRLWGGAIGRIGGTVARRELCQRVAGWLAQRAGSAAVVLYNQDPLLAGEILRLCRDAGVPFVQQFAEMHIAADYPARWLYPYYLREQLHLRRVPRRADGNLVISSTLRDLVERAGGREVLQLPSFVDAGAWQERIARHTGGPEPGRVVYAGEGARRDCLQTMIQAAAVARKRGVKLTLRMVGLAERARRAGASLAAKCGLRDACEFVGRIGPDQLAGEYARASALLLLRTDDQSSRACFPTRLGEMLLTGRPVIMSDIPDYNLMFAHRRNAYLAAPESVESVADCLREALQSDGRPSAIGAAGRQVALTRLNIDSYRSLVGEWLERVEDRRALDR